MDYETCTNHVSNSGYQKNHTKTILTRRVCSNCALLFPSAVTAVQPSGHILSLHTPACRPQHPFWIHQMKSCSDRNICVMHLDHNISRLWSLRKLLLTCVDHGFNGESLPCFHHSHSFVSCGLKLRKNQITFLKSDPSTIYSEQENTMQPFLVITTLYFVKRSYNLNLWIQYHALDWSQSSEIFGVMREWGEHEAGDTTSKKPHIFLKLGPGRSRMNMARDSSYVCHTKTKES